MTDDDHHAPPGPDVLEVGDRLTQLARALLIAAARADAELLQDEGGEPLRLVVLAGRGDILGMSASGYGSDHKERAELLVCDLLGAAQRAMAEVGEMSIVAVDPETGESRAF